MAAGGRGMLVIPVTADVDATIRNLRKAEEELGRLGGTATREAAKSTSALGRLGKMGGQLKHKLLGPLEGLGPALSIAGVVEFGREAFKTAMEGQQAEARLQAAVKATGETYRGNAEDIEASISAMRNYGFAGDQTKAALSRLIMTTHNTAKATSEMSLVANVARARHIDLESAATLVGKVMAGNTAALKRLGIDLGITNGNLASQKKAQEAVRKAQEDVTAAEKRAAAQHGKSQSANDALVRAREKLAGAESKLKDTHDATGRALTALNKIMGGQAAAASETAAGKIEVMKAKFHDLKEAIGNKLIGAFVFLTKHMDLIGPAIAAVVGGMIAWKVASAGVAIANALMGTSLVAAETPILPIVIGLGLLVGAGLLLAKHWKAVWRDVKAWALDAWHFLDNGVFRPIEHAVGFLVSMWVTEFRMIADVFLNFVGMMLHGAAAAFGWVPGIGGKLKKARDAFDVFHKGVDDSLSGIANSARNWGSKVSANFASGILTGKHAAQKAAAAVALEVSGTLRHQSPAKYGPMSEGGGAEGWGARFSQLYAAGVASNAGAAGDAAARIAGQIADKINAQALAPLRLTATAAARAAIEGGSARGVANAYGTRMRAPAFAMAGPVGRSVQIAGARGGDTINITIEPGVYNARELAKDIRDELVKLKRRNGGTGLED